MNILGLYRAGSGCDFHRVVAPLRSFPIKDGDNIQLISERDELTYNHFHNADIVFFNRTPSFSIEVLKELKKEHGFYLVVDIDDYWELYYHHMLYQVWKNNDTTKNILECIRLADLVTCTNEQLAAQIQLINDNIEVLYNSVTYDTGQYAYNPIEHDRVNIVYAGGSSHYHDLKSISGLFKRLGSDGEFRKNGKFTLAGYTNPHNSQSSIWWKILGVVKPIKNLELIEAVPITDYMKCYDAADLSIAPLEDNFFNSMKSNLKTIESGSKHLPIVTSANLPYSIDSNVQGVTLCHKSSDFYDTIKNYLKNPLKIKEDGLALYDYVTKRYNFKEINQLRYEIFTDLLNS